jgi:hypothetical protein
MEPVCRIIFYHMITIFHGDDQVKSREAFLSAVTSDTLKLDSKNIDLNQVNNYLNEGSLFGDTKTIAISNFFTIPKANLDKIVKLILKTKVNVVIWQDKLLNVTQLKTFPKATILSYKADNSLYSCLNSIKPKNLNRFIVLYDKVINQNLFDLFLYLLKAKFRKLLQFPSTFDQKVILRTYLQIIELEYQYKSGQLSFSKDLALKRVLLPLLR